MQVIATEFSEHFAAGTVLLRAGELDEALRQFKAVYSDAETTGNMHLMASSLCEIAWTCFKMGDPEQGLECAVGAKWLWRRLGNSEELARALAVEAFLFLDLGLGDEAFDLSGEALDLAQRLDAPAILAFTLNVRAVVLAVSQESELALSLLEQAVDLARAAGNKTAAAFYTLNKGFAHAKLGELENKVGRAARAAEYRALAIEHSLAAADLAASAGDLWTLRVALCNGAEFLSADGRNGEATALLDRWAGLPGEVSASLHIHHLYTLGQVRHAAGQHRQALAACTDALSLAEAKGQIDHQVNAAEILSRILEAMGDAPAALSMHRRYHRLFVQQSGETARRRARVEEIRTEADRLRARAAELADQALSDPLTGIANRRSFDQILERLAGSPVAVAIVDLDNFKRINDRHTHIAGDAVLQRVARVMVDQIATHGHVARLGGEEFALIFPEAPLATAAAFCEGIRVAIANADWEALTPGMRVTVSIGVAAGDGTHPTGELMQRADSRLYLAKQGGRDRVFAEDHPAATRQAGAAS